MYKPTSRRIATQTSFEILSGSLMQTWQQGNWKHQGMIITELCRVLQSISEEDAQALPLKDPETGGFQDKLCSMCHACGHCCPLKAKSK